MWISVNPNRQEHWTPTFFKNKCLGCVILSLDTPQYDRSCVYLTVFNMELNANLAYLVQSGIMNMKQAAGEEVSSPSPSPSTPPFEPSTSTTLIY